MTTSKKAKTIYFNLMYWLVRFRTGFTAIILLAAAIFAYQYWQVLNAHPEPSSAPSFATDKISITLLAPDTLAYTDDNSLPEFMPLLSLKATEPEININTENPILVSVQNNENMKIYENTIAWANLQSQSHLSLQIPVTKIFHDDIKENELTILIQVDSENLYIKRNIQLEHRSENFFVLLSAVISFLTALFGIINQIKTLIKK